MDTSLDITRALTVSIRLSEGCPRIGGVLPDVLIIPGWLRTLDADLLGLNSAWKYAQDREHWKHLVETAVRSGSGHALTARSARALYR